METEKTNYNVGNLYQFAKENVKSFVTNSIGSFIIGVGAKYHGDGNLMNPLVFGALSTPIIDVFEYFFVKKRDLNATIRNDVGTFAGQTLGWTLASLL